MLRQAMLILSGNAAASLVLMLRNLIVARLIPVEDYGIAATFAVVMALVEMASSFGLHQQIVQAKEGDDPRFQASLQGFQIIRGLASAIALFLVASPLATFMGIPQVAWAYQVLAIVPVLNALVHFDIHRLNRQMRFGPLLWNGILPAIASLLLIYPLVVFFGDWRVMLWAIVAQAAATAVSSHLLAERPWRLGFDRMIIAGSLRFGWPILLNAILLFMVFQADKLIIGRIMGMEALAIFAMGLTFTLTPTLVLAKSFQNLALPRLSKCVGTPAFNALALKTMTGVSLAAVAFVSLCLVLGGPMLDLLLGEKYSDLIPLFLWLAISQTLRVMKAGPAIVAIALGQTVNPFLANVLRVLALPFAVFAAMNGADLKELLLIAIVAELAGLILSLWLVLQRTDLSPWQTFVPFVTMLSIVAAVAGMGWVLPATASVPPWPIWLGSMTGLAISAMTVLRFGGWRQRP